MKLRLLVACECSGRVRDAFAARGWEAWSADLLECEVPSYITVRNKDDSVTDPDATEHGNHYVGDVCGLFNPYHPVNRARYYEIKRVLRCTPWPAPPIWDMIIAHPPCDHLSYAGARWFKQKQADGRQEQGLSFFGEMLRAPSPLVAVENPHSIAQVRYGKPTQVVEPWWFGDPFKKEIHLWLKGLSPLMMDMPVEWTGRVTTGGGSHRTDKAAQRKAMSAYEDSEGRKNRAKVRSRTMPGLARAMAEQWGTEAALRYATRV